MTKFLGAAGVAVLLVFVAACGGTNNKTDSKSGNNDATQIRSRVDSVVNHINNGDAKAILDDDVPASARRTCSDKDAKDTVGTLRQQMQAAGAKLSVTSVTDVSVSGNKATANVVFATGLASIPDTSPVPMPFVKDGGSWKVDTSDSSGCNGLIPSTFG